MNRWEKAPEEDGAPDDRARADARRQQVEDAVQAVDVQESRRRRFDRSTAEASVATRPPAPLSA